jgi:hypothetical protein
MADESNGFLLIKIIYGAGVVKISRIVYAFSLL